MRRIILSTDSVNVYGYRLLSDGCDLSLFTVNPVLLYMHERGVIIGKWKDVKIENGQITAEPVFAKTAKGKEAQQLYEEEMLNMASVWAEPIEWSEDTSLMIPGQTGATVTKWILKEASLVDVAGNKDCVKLVNNDGSEFKLSDLKKPLKTDSEMKKIALFLKLSDSASEDAILEAVQRVHTEHADLTQKLADKTTEATGLATENKSLKEQIKARKLADFDALLNDPAKKLTDAQKATYKKLFEGNEESTIEAVKALPTYQNLSDNGGQKQADGSRKDWKWEDYTRKDPKALEAMKLNDKEAYKALFTAKFGKEPKI